MTNYPDAPEPKLGRLYPGIAFSIILMYFLGAIFYADPFNFWQHTLTELGTTKTLLGSPNMPAALIVTTPTSITGRMLQEAARVYRNIGFDSSRQAAQQICLISIVFEILEEIQGPDQQECQGIFPSSS